MAVLNTIDYQKYVQLPDGMVIGIHKVTLLTAGDQFSVPALADPANAGRSVAQLRRQGDTAVTVSSNVATNSTNNITVVGAAGTQCTIVSFHQANTSSPGPRR